MSAKPLKSESKQGRNKSEKGAEKEKRKDSLSKLKKDDKGGTASPTESTAGPDSGAAATAAGADSGAKENECPPPCCEPCCEPCCDPCCDPCCMPCCEECEDENQQNSNDECGGQQDAACDNNDKPQNSDDCEDDYGEESLTILQCRFPYVELEVLEDLLQQTGNNVESVEELLSV